MSRRRIVTVLGILAAAAAIALGVPTLLSLLEPEGDERVVVVLKTTGRHMEFWQIVRAGIQEAATELDVEPSVVGPRWERDVDRQIEIFANVVDQNPEGILIAASDYNRLVPIAERAASRGITIVTLDSALNSDVPISFVATDNVAAGRKAGKEINRLVPMEERVAVISHIKGVATAIDREAGVRQELAVRDEDKVLGTFYSENDPDRAYEIVSDLLESYPDLGGVVALNENSTVGVGRAIRDLGLTDRVDLVGFDNSKEEIEFLEKGILEALVVQRPFNMGYLGIRTLVRALRGERVEPVIHTDSVLVRKDDMYTEENQKLLFPIVQER
jgi:ribose transport system substrate-binding protein